MVAIPAALLASTNIASILTQVGPPTNPLTAAVTAYRKQNGLQGAKNKGDPTQPSTTNPEWKPADFDHEDFATVAGPVLPVQSNFADPSYIEVDNVRYAFATNNRGQTPAIKVQVAQSLDQGNTWSLLMDGAKQHDAMPVAGDWSSGNRVWAPDIIRLDDGTFVMYYTADVKGHPRFHCVGTATSTSILGPYTPQSSAFACPIGKELGGDSDTNQGGAIDPDGFFDKDSNKRYVAYKVDGNSIGHGGTCGNWPLNGDPVIPTPIMLQEVSATDGITKIGPPVQILDRDDRDGPLIEAPSMYKANGVYFLFFSSNCFAGPLYDTNYATSTSILGPYEKSARPLFVTGDGQHLLAPGGTDIAADGSFLVFHGSMKNLYTNDGNGKWMGDFNNRDRNTRDGGKDDPPENIEPDTPTSGHRPGLIRSMYTAKPSWDGHTVHI